MSNKELEQIAEDEQLDEFKATGEPSEVPEPTATKNNSRKADKSAGDKSTPKLDDKTPGQTKSQMLAAMMSKGNGMSKKNLQTAYDAMMGKNAASIKPKGDAKSVSYKEDIDDMFGTDLDENFREKAETIFSAAVNAKVIAETARIEEEFEAKLDEIKKDIEEDTATRVDHYLNYVTEEWVKDNEVAIESNFKVEIAESLMTGLKKLFVENHIEISDDKLDVAAELATSLEESEAKLNEEIESKIQLQQIVEEYKRKDVIIEASDGLVDTQKEKLQSLVEGIDASTIEEFSKKVTIIKENYFGEKQLVTESVDEEPIETDEETTKVSTDPTMSNYAAAITRTVKR